MGRRSGAASPTSPTCCSAWSAPAPASGTRASPTCSWTPGSPGIEIRPIRDLTGGADFCSITFTDVEAPVANRIGEEGGGWPIARTSLGHERAGARSIQDILAKGEPGPASSASRILAAEFEQRLHVLALDIIGAAGMLDRRDPHAVQRGRWVWGFLRTRASTIGTGTSEIQRNTVAERVLGLPRDP